MAILDTLRQIEREREEQEQNRQTPTDNGQQTTDNE
jgi:hypothetical protein